MKPDKITWEYQYIFFHEHDKLKKAGEQEWEVYGMTSDPAGNNVIYFLKRPIRWYIRLRSGGICFVKEESVR